MLRYLLTLRKAVFQFSQMKESERVSLSHVLRIKNTKSVMDIHNHSPSLRFNVPRTICMKYVFKQLVFLLNKLLLIMTS